MLSTKPFSVIKMPKFLDFTTYQYDGDTISTKRGPDVSFVMDGDDIIEMYINGLYVDCIDKEMCPNYEQTKKEIFEENS